MKIITIIQILILIFIIKFFLLKDKELLTIFVRKDKKEKQKQKLNILFNCHQEILQFLIQLQKDLGEFLGDQPVIDLNKVTETNLDQDQIILLINQRLPFAVSQWKNIEIQENNQNTFVQNKGELLNLTVLNDNLDIHEKNDIIYVLVHEVSHIINVLWGHGELFWQINIQMLKFAIYYGVYVFVDYEKKPVTFGVVPIEYNLVQQHCDDNRCYYY